MEKPALQLLRHARLRERQVPRRVASQVRARARGAGLRAAATLALSARALGIGTIKNSARTPAGEDHRRVVGAWSPRSLPPPHRFAASHQTRPATALAPAQPPPPPPPPPLALPGSRSIGPGSAAWRRWRAGKRSPIRRCGFQKHPLFKPTAASPHDMSYCSNTLSPPLGLLRVRYHHPTNPTHTAPPPRPGSSTRRRTRSFRGGSQSRAHGLRCGGGVTLS